MDVPLLMSVHFLEASCANLVSFKIVVLLYWKYHVIRATGLLEWRDFILNTLNPTIFNIIHWADVTNDSLTKPLMFQALFFFLNFLLDLGHSKLYRLKWFLQRILQEIMKIEIILGTSDAWLMSCLSQQPSLALKLFHSAWLCWKDSSSNASLTVACE